MAAMLDEFEARLLGSLVEKSLTTPEFYPLTLNSLLNACNQKSSRDPVMSLDEAGVGKSLHSLLAKGLAERVHEPGSRVPKFKHRIDILVKSLDPKVIGAVCVLLLRGPQTPGEIKTRTERLCRFESSAEAEILLQELGNRPEGAQAAKLPRQPGQKENRYRHLFGAGAPAAPVAAAAPAPAAKAPSSNRLSELEKRVSALEAAVRALPSRGS